MSLSGDYDSSLAPKQTVNGVKVDEPLPIHVGVDIFNFDKIDTKKMMFSVMIRVNLTWKERRLKYLNLRDDIYENMISAKVRQDVWIPEIGNNDIDTLPVKVLNDFLAFAGFYNARTGSVEKELFAAFMVRRDSGPDMPDPSRPKEDYVFDGSSNALMLIRR